MQKAIKLGTKEETSVEINMPLVALKKSQIVQKSLELSVPLEHTWSCYQEENEACGMCDSCRLRLNAFKETGVKDPIVYR